MRIFLSVYHTAILLKSWDVAEESLDVLQNKIFTYK
jgi:hypothetical protein